MIRKEVLDSGLKIITEEIAQVRSVSLGIWVKTGSRDETNDNNGISHFIEHLLFKGTKNRTAREIARTLEAVGGILNASTGKELTCYYAQVLDKHLGLAVDLLSDLILNPLFAIESMEKERNVIEEEIKRYEDTPEALIYDLFTQTIWDNHSLGQPILGSKKVISALSRQDIIDYFQKGYTAPNMVISVAGNIIHCEVVKSIKSSFHSLPSDVFPLERKVPQIRSQVKVKEKKDLEQVHLCLGVKGLPQNHKGRYALAVLNTILGGGMSSRLFQRIREKEGLVYSIDVSSVSYKDAGLLVVSLGTSPQNLLRVIKLIKEELNGLKEKKASSPEFLEAKEQLKGNLMLSLENTNARMNRLANMEIYLDKLFTLDEIIKKIEEVKEEDVQRLANELFKKENLALTAIGSSLDKEKLEKVWG